MKGFKLYEVAAALGVCHLTVAKSTGHACQVVSRQFSLPLKELTARKLSDLSAPEVIRSDYPQEF